MNGRGGSNWARGVLRRLEDAEQAVGDGQVGAAFDAYAVAYLAIASRWPDHIDSEENLDDWFARESDASDEFPALSEALSNLLWMRVRLDEDEEERRTKLCRIADDIIPRLTDGDYLVREAYLACAISHLIDAADGAHEEALELCKRYAEDPWLRLELSRAYGHLRPLEKRDLELARHFAEEALELGGEETDLFVYEDLTSLYEDAGDTDAGVALDKDFWTPERVGRALKTYGAEPPVSVIEAALRFDDEIVNELLGILRSAAIRVQSDLIDDASDESQGTLWWSSVHALRLVAALRVDAAAGDVANWLNCDIAEVREVLPLVASRLGAAIIAPFARILNDRDESLRARSGAIIGLAAAGLVDNAVRPDIVRHLRFWAFNGNAPRGLRTEAAYRLVTLADEPSREAIEEGLESGDLDRFLFDEDDIGLFYGDEPDGEGPDAAHELGLDEAPLAVYYEHRDDSNPLGADESEVEDLADLIAEVTALELSDTQARRLGGSGPAAPFARGRRRLALTAAEELGLKGWLDSLYLFLGPGPHTAHDCQHLGLEWPFVDFVTSDIVDREGVSLARRFLVSPPLMSADERTAIERIADSHVTLLEVVKTPDGPEGTVTCRDIFSGERSKIHLPLQLEPVRWDLLLGRIVEGDRSNKVLLYARHLPRRALANMMEEIGAGARQLETMLPPAAPPSTGLHLATATYFAQTIRAESSGEPPTVRDRDGTPIVFSEAMYEIADLEPVVAALTDIEGFHRLAEEGPEPNPNGNVDFRWLGPEDNDLLPEARRLLGELIVRGQRLTLRCHTRDQLTEGRDMIESAVGDAMSHLADTFADPGAVAFREERLAAQEEEDDGPHREESQRIVTALIERHYERWVDEGLPALHGRSPREAADEPEHLPALQELLRVIENIEAHRERMEGVAFDVGRLRRELGLDDE